MLIFLPLWASAASPKRILILDPFGRDAAPFSVASSAFRTTLAREFDERLEFYEISLDRARYSEPEKEDPFVDFLQSRIADRPMDLVATIGKPGMDFILRHRQRLFPSTPIVFIAGPASVTQTDSMRTHAIQVTHTLNLAGMVEDILQLQPQTTNIMVVFGASQFETSWANRSRREFQPFTNRVAFTWLSDLPFEKVLERCAALPPHSFILHVMFLVDAAGIPFEQNEPLRRLHAVANAPIFGYFANEFGLGSIGGRLYQDSEIGVQAGRAAVRLLRGEPPEQIPQQILEATTPIYDGRELRRWGISEARLPVGSVVRFREMGFWERYRWPIAGVVSFCLLQAALIIGLLVNRTQRREGEAAATLIAEISSKFVNLPSDELDREILEAQRRLGELLDVDLLILWQLSGDTPNCYSATHFYTAQEGLQAPAQLHEEDYPWYRQELLAARMVGFSSLKELPVEATRDRKSFRELGIQSSLCLPLSVGGGPLIGAFSLNVLRAERGWPDVLVKRLQVVAQIFANALARKRADLALRESEERMTLAAEAAGFGVWIWSMPRDQVWGSERWLHLFGFASDEEVGLEKVIQRIHPDDRGSVEHEIRGTLQNGGNYAREFRVVLPDGTQRWLASRGRTQTDGTGNGKRLLGATVDVTARKESEERFRLTVEASPNGIVLVNPQGRIELVNRQTELLFGYPRAELIGQPIDILLPDQFRSSHPGHMAGFFAAPQARAMSAGRELFARRKDGTEFPVEIGLSPIQTADGVLVLTAILDITARKRAEGALRDLSGRLIRAHEEERARLARELHDDLTQRVARLAIDAGQVERGVDAGAAAETIRSIRDGLVRLGEDIHALSYRLHPSVLEDLGLAEALRTECERFARQESIYTQVNIGELPSDIPAETALCLFRVTQEALRNVARHARAHRVKVSVRATDDGLQLAVLDDGVGFEPAAPRDRPSLGLASMRERVFSVGGELDIESAPGQGTTILVSVTLKRLKAEGRRQKAEG